MLNPAVHQHQVLAGDTSLNTLLWDWVATSKPGLSRSISASNAAVVCLLHSMRDASTGGGEDYDGGN
jgi:hypothetical protein